MASRVQIPVEEYLRASYQDGDRDYLDGEVVDRNVGNERHSECQWRLSGLFHRLKDRVPVHGRPEIRLRIAERRYRVADFAVFGGEPPRELVPSSPALAIVEILSPDDRMEETLEKLEDYRVWGVRHIWLIHPEAQRFYVYAEGSLREAATLELPEFEIKVLKRDLFPAQ